MKKLLDMTETELKTFIKEVLDEYLGNIRPKYENPTYMWDIDKNELIKLSEQYGVFK